MIEREPIAGSTVLLEARRDGRGRLIELSAGGTVYLRGDGPRRTFGDLASVLELPMRCGVERVVTAAGQRWTERYRWDAHARPIEIDGVAIARDERHRITACGAWRYHYQGHHLIAIEGPRGARRIERGDDGRPVRHTGRAGIAYDGDARRDCPRAPARWSRDALGRLWTVRGPGGEITATYLWDGMLCLGRIDGPPGAPLAACFSLDPTGTPVRVIDRAGARRIPRDAFGEALCDEPGVPGLFGGAQHGGFVYLRARALDPRTGSFHAPDPWHGGDGDPRRRDGDRGPLTVERAPSGPYAVCRYDAIAGVDPTGESTLGVFFSMLTWSWSNTLVSFLGLDLTINFWLSLLLFWTKRSVFRSAGFFNTTGLHASRSGNYGLRRSGVLASDRAFTVQHWVFSSPAGFNDEKRAGAWVPSARFAPRLYGTALLGEPSRGDPFVLRGINAAFFTRGGDTTFLQHQAGIAWSRAGGKAEPITSDVPFPIFPSGALHFDRIPGLESPQPCKLTELEPAAAPPARGHLQDRTLVAIDSAATGLGVDHLVFVSDGGGGQLVRVFEAVVNGTTTEVYLDGDGTGLASKVRLQAVAVPGPSPRAAATPATSLPKETGTLRDTDKIDLPAPPSPAPPLPVYTTGAPLRLTPATGPAIARILDRFEVQVRIDARLEALSPPLTVALGSLSTVEQDATLVPADGNLLEIEPTKPVPPPGKPILVTLGARSLAVVTARKREPDVGGKHRVRVDRSLSGLGSGAIKWKQLTAGTRLGTRSSALETGTDLTFTAQAAHNRAQLAPGGTAPVFLVIEDPKGTIAAREVTGVTYDALVTRTPIVATAPGAATSYQVEAFAWRGLDEKDLERKTVQLFVVDNPADIVADLAAFQLAEFSGNTVAVSPIPSGLSTGTLSADQRTLTGTVQATFPVVDHGSEPRVGAPAVLVQGGTREAAVVKRLAVTLVLQHKVEVALTGLEAIRLDLEGPTYDVTQDAADPLRLTVEPTMAHPSPPPAKLVLQMPHFDEGEPVQLAWKDAAGTAFTSCFRIADIERAAQVDGTTIKIDGLGDRPASGATDLKLTRLTAVPSYPATGTSREGIAGVPVGVTPAPGATTVQADQVRFDVWWPRAFCRDSPPVPGGAAPAAEVIAGIITGGRTWPVVIQSAAPRDYALELTAPSTFTGTADVRVADVFARHAPLPTRHGAAFLLKSGTPSTPPPAASPNLVVAVQLRRSTLAADGALDSGSNYIPSDVEGHELKKGAPRAIDWYDSLETHELRHTQQYATWGPLFWGWFPIAALDDAFWTESRGWAKELSQLFTPGGLLNVTFGSVWGGLATAILGLFRSVKVTTFPATVEQDGAALRLADDAGRSALAGATRVVIKKDDHSAVRAVTSADGGVLGLATAVDYRDQVEVMPYTQQRLDSARDTHDYFPALVDAADRAVVRPQPLDGNTLSLKRDDRVRVVTDHDTFARRVDQVDADGAAHLNQGIPEGSEVRVAKIGDGDPLSDIDVKLLDETFDADWIRYLTDPYGHWVFQPEKQQHNLWKFVTEVGRSLLSSRAFSVLFPPGWYFFDNLPQQLISNGVRSQIEQEAAEDSGHLYSPLAKLRVTPEVVGDLGRLWFFVDTPFASVTLQGFRGDGPGVHHRPTPRLMPAYSDTAGTSGFPNLKIEAGAVAGDPGGALPDMLAAKPGRDPRDAAAPATAAPGAVARDDLEGPRSFVAGPRAYIPTEPAISRCTGIYAAFTRPGKHRLTVENHPGFEASHKAQTTMRWDTWMVLNRPFTTQKTQTILFDLEIKPVEVKAMGIARADDATIEVVLTQKLQFTVSPGGERRYGLTMRRPRTGDILRAETPDSLRARTTPGSERVELSRVYRYDRTRDAFDGDVLNQHKMHLPRDLYVPVRRFTIQVVNTLPLRAKLSVADADILRPVTPATAPVVRPGSEVFLLVPATPLGMPRLAPITYDPPPPAPAPPVPTPPPFAVVPYTDPLVPPERVAKPPADVNAFVAPEGRVFRIGFPADEPPEEKATLTYQLAVGVPGDSGTLTATVELKPHLVARRVAGTGYDLGRSSSVDFKAFDPDDAGATPIEVDPPVVTPDTGVTVAMKPDHSFTLIIGPTAAGSYRLTVTRKGNPDQRGRRTFQVH